MHYASRGRQVERGFTFMELLTILAAVFRPPATFGPREGSMTVSFQRPSASQAWRCPVRRPIAGFSMVELLVVVALIATVSGMAAMAMPRMVRQNRADGEMKRVISELRRARDVAISQRRNVLVEFPAVNQIRIVRQDVTNGAVSGTTALETVTMEGGLTYQPFTALGDTPDGFGRTSAQSFGTATARMFTSEGTFVDQTGDPVNGTITVGIYGDNLTARAITVFGATALIRGYRWNGREWST